MRECDTDFRKGSWYPKQPKQTNQASCRAVVTSVVADFIGEARHDLHPW